MRPAVRSIGARGLVPVRGALALVTALLAACGSEPPVLEADPDRDAGVDRPVFDGASAMELVERQVAFGPRIPGSEGHRAQLEWMVDLLEPAADTVVVDSFTHRTRSGVDLPLRNVRATFVPAEPRADGRRLLLLAHWDTRPRSDASPLPGADTIPVPGANDGASGVAVLLELARMLERAPPPVTVDLLFVDGEDYGPLPEDMFLGSTHFAAKLPPGYAPAYGVLLDMVGDRDPSFPIEGNSMELAPEVARRVWSVAHDLGYAAEFPMQVGPRIGDDHIPLNRAGIPTIDIIDFTYGGPDNPLWHTPDDVPEAVGAGTLGMVGDVVTELVYRGG